MTDNKINTLGKEHVNRAIVEMTRPQMYRFMKYWGKKPHNIFRTYIEHYSEPDEIVLDAFAGVGSCPFEAIQTGRKAIAVELNPIAIFIMDMIATPFDERKFLSYYKQIHDEMVKFEKETKLFQTTCENCGKIGRIINIHYDGVRPFKIRYRCVCSKEPKSKVPDMDDIETIYMSQNLELKWWYPQDEFPESEAFDLAKKEVGKCFYNLWTRRVLYFLSFLYDKIESIDDETIRNFMKFAFISTLHLTTKMVSARREKSERPDSGSWGRPAYLFPKRHLEQNPFYVFGRRIFNKNQGLLVAKNSSNKLLGNKINFAKNFDELKNSSKNFLLLQKNSIELTKFIPKESVDYVLTDPPYADLIKYFDLSSIWSVWLKGKDNNSQFEIPYVEEIIVHDKKELSNYERMMYKAFLEIKEILKSNHYMTLTFHNQNPEIFDLIIKLVRNAGFVIEKIMFQPNKRASESGVANPWGSAIVDYYIRCRKPSKDEVLKEGLNKEGFEKLVIESAKRIIARRGQPTELPFIIDEIWVELYKYGQFFETTTKDIVSLLNSKVGIEFKKIKTENEKKQLQEKWWLEKPEEVIKHPELPLSERIEKAIIQTLYKKGKASYDEIMDTLFQEFPNSLTPATDGSRVKALLKEYAQKTSDGKWILKQNVRHYESMHIEIIKILAEIGKKLGFQIWCPDRNKNEILKRICLEKLELPINEDKAKRVKEIDVLWLKDGKIVCSFDVEHSTPLFEALIRASNLPDVNFTKKYILLPRERKNLFDRRMKEELFVKEWKERDWKLGFFEELEKFYKKRKLNVEEFEEIFNKEAKQTEKQTVLK
jgi:DNA modification methylase